MAKSKGDTDKDMLFSKILPALNDNPFSATYGGSQPSQPQFEPDGDDELTALRNRLFARGNISDAHGSYATLNVMENMVLKYIDQVIKRFNTCSCDRCRCDVAAYALNHLQPKYIVAEPTRMAEAEEEIGAKLVIDALVNAVIQVRASPRH